MEILYGEILNLRDLDSVLTTCEGETEEKLPIQMRRETNQLNWNIKKYVVIELCSNNRRKQIQWKLCSLYNLKFWTTSRFASSEKALFSNILSQTLEKMFQGYNRNVK